MCAFSKNWTLRDAALQKLEKDIKAGKLAKDPRETFRVVARLISKGLKDKVGRDSVRFLSFKLQLDVRRSVA